MAKTFPEKLFIKPGYRVVVVNAPEGYLTDTLVDLPEGVTVTEVVDGDFDTVQAFITTAEDAEARVADLKTNVKPSGNLWMCYPKGGAKAKIPTDLNRDSLAALVQAHGFKAIQQISIDDTWSGLGFKVVEG